MLIINEKIALKKFLSTNSYSFLLTTFSIAFIVWVIQAVNNLEFVSEDGHSFLVYFYYTLLIFPKIIGKILPVIFFVTLFHTLIKYENSNELKIFWINGLSKIEFYNVILKYTIIFFIIQVIITSFLGPFSQNKAREYIKESTLDFFPSLFQEKKFIDTVEKLTIFIESKSADNEFNNIYLKDETNKYPRIIFAKKGELLLSANTRILRLTDGKFININKSGTATSFNFKTTDFNLSKFLTKSTTHTKLQERKLSKLVMCINFILIKKETYYNHGINCNNSSINEIMSEVYTRVFKPLFLFLLSLIVIFLLSGNIENKNFNYIKGFVFSSGIIAIILSEIFVDYSGKNTSNMMVAILFPLIIFSILYILFYTQVNRANNKK